MTTKEKEYDNFFEMISDIEKHVKEHGGSILLSDDPRTLRIGFACNKTNDEWLMRIIHFKNLQNGKLENIHYNNETSNKIFKLYEAVFFNRKVNGPLFLECLNSGNIIKFLNLRSFI